MTAARGSLWVAEVCVADPLWVARSDAERVRGLLGRAGLPRGEALLIERCNGIHMFGMRFAIDVIFLDAEGVVVRAKAGLKPWRLARGGRAARYALEAEAGWLDRRYFQPGVRFAWRIPELA